MDKRTLLFIILFSFALFAVNIYFEGDRQEELRRWQEYQKTKQEEETKKAATSEKQPEKITPPLTETKKTEEKYYVLETPYQQLFFSNVGAAVSEISLP